MKLARVKGYYCWAVGSCGVWKHKCNYS